jgi:hypothetical protein
MTYTECDEIADEIKAPVINNFSEALVIIRRMLPDESETVVSNIAYALYRKGGA